MTNIFFGIFSPAVVPARRPADFDRVNRRRGRGDKEAPGKRAHLLKSPGLSPPHKDIASSAGVTGKTGRNSPGHYVTSVAGTEISALTLGRPNAVQLLRSHHA
jgi:hypothetical protein